MPIKGAPFAGPSFISEGSMPPQACSQLPTLVAIVTLRQRESSIVVGINSLAWQHSTKPGCRLHRETPMKQPWPHLSGPLRHIVPVWMCMGGKEEVNQGLDEEEEEGRECVTECVGGVHDHYVDLPVLLLFRTIRRIHSLALLWLGQCSVTYAAHFSAARVVTG